MIPHLDMKTFQEHQIASQLERGQGNEHQFGLQIKAKTKQQKTPNQMLTKRKISDSESGSPYFQILNVCSSVLAFVWVGLPVLLHLSGVWLNFSFFVNLGTDVSS